MPVSEDSLQRRKILSGIMKLLVFIGFIFVSIPFISSFSTSTTDKQQAKSHWVITLPLNVLTPGEVKTFPWAGGAVWIYHRTESEIQALKQHGLLRDAFSEKSDQPQEMKNDLRSANEKYFVFIPLENKRGCQVRLDRHAAADGEAAIFVEPCYGARYDAAGRIFKNSGKPDQNNLPVPEHVIEAGILKVGVWRPKK